MSEPLGAEAYAGMVVRYTHPDNGYEHQIQFAKKRLVLGQEYTVEKVEIYDWHTELWLEGIDTGKQGFNSVMFVECNVLNY